MKCGSCGADIPDDSTFCQYCGLKITYARHSPETPAAPKPAAVSEPMRIAPTSPTVSAASAGAPCAAPQGRRGRIWIVFTACLAVLLIVLAVLLVFQYNAARKSETRVAELTETVNELNERAEELKSEISEKELELKAGSAEIASLEAKISNLESDGKNYRTILRVLNKGNFGYASKNFRASENIIKVSRFEEGRTFTLTANWTRGGTVSVEYDSYNPAARVSFNRDSWYSSVDMTVEPIHAGLTVVTFSNSVDSRTFSIIIIVL